jgi:hypothetical protein
MIVLTKKLRRFFVNAGLSLAILVGLMIFRRFAAKERMMITSRQSA